MTLDEVIEKLIEAKEHCVQGNSEVIIQHCSPRIMINNATINSVTFDSKQVYIEI